MENMRLEKELSHRSCDAVTSVENKDNIESDPEKLTEAKHETLALIV